MPLHSALEALRLDDAYLSAHPQSPYWTLAPHHRQQMTESSCSLATTVMLLNALGVAVDESGLLERLDDAGWRANIDPDTGEGLPLRALPERWRTALAAFGLAGWQVETVPVTNASDALPGLRAALGLAESGEAWIAVNFHFDGLYGDGTQVGHWSPLGAFDAGRDRILVLDVYKKDYPPHWVPLPHLAEALAIGDPVSGEPRGYVMLRRA